MDWQLLFQYACTPDSPRILLGRDVQPRTCKFCGGRAPAVTFRKRAHVIPAACGNRRLLSAQECDACNEELGSPLEDQLLKWLSPVRVLLPEAGAVKLRVPPYQSYVRRRPGEALVRIREYAEEDAVTMRDLGDRSFELRIKLPPCDASAMARALARLAVFVLDPAEFGLEEVLAWVRGQRSWVPLHVDVVLWPTRSPETRLVVGRNLDTSGRWRYQVVLAYSCLVLIMDLPDSQGLQPVAFTWPPGLPTPESGAPVYRLEIQAEGAQSGLTAVFTGQYATHTVEPWDPATGPNP